MVASKTTVSDSLVTLVLDLHVNYYPYSFGISYNSMQHLSLASGIHLILRHMVVVRAILCRCFLSRSQN